MTSVEMCPKQAVIRGREGCQPDTWDYSEGLQLVYTSGGQSETVILSGDMDLHQRHAASLAWQNCEKEEWCVQIVSCFSFFLVQSTKPPHWLRSVFRSNYWSQGGNAGL